MNLRALQLIVTQGNWAIAPSWYEFGQAIIEGNTEQVEALVAKRGESLSVMTERRNSVAVLSIYGAIYSRGSLMADLCDAPTPESILREFTTALNDPSISAIVLNVESPGGVVAGTAEVADAIYAARGKKPICAYVAAQAASAAYWIASAADEVVINKTASVGSIGVIAGYYKNSSTNIVEFVSSQSPKKRLDPASESGRAAIQEQIDNLAAVFITDVARNRAVTTAKVESDFGRGGVLIGEHAVKAGLADRLGSFEQLISELSAGTWKRKPNKPAMAANAEAESQEDEDMKFSELLAKLGISLDDAKAELKEPDTKTTQAQVDEEAAQWKAEAMKLRAERRERIEADAQTYATQLLKDAKALPFQAAAIVDDYTTAATDDLDSPLAEGSRVAKLKARHDAMKAHSLLTEQVASEKAAALMPDKADDEKAINAQRKDELLAMTPLGQQALAQRADARR